MTGPASRTGDPTHELVSSLSALLLGLQRLRKLTGDSDRERALALIDRMERSVHGMAALLQSAREGPGGPGGPGSGGRPPGEDS